MLFPFSFLQVEAMEATVTEDMAAAEAMEAARADTVVAAADMVEETGADTEAVETVTKWLTGFPPKLGTTIFCILTRIHSSSLLILL